MTEDRKNELVKKVLKTLLDECKSPIEVLDVLVPIAAASLERVNVEPSDVVQYFTRVTRLLDNPQHLEKYR